MRARKARCGLRIAGGRGGGTWSLTSLLSTRAPAAMRARTASARPCLAAWCSGVIPCPAPPPREPWTRSDREGRDRGMRKRAGGSVRHQAALCAPRGRFHIALCQPPPSPHPLGLRGENATSAGGEILRPATTRATDGARPRGDQTPLAAHRARGPGPGAAGSRGPPKGFPEGPPPQRPPRPPLVPPEGGRPAPDSDAAPARLDPRCFRHPTADSDIRRPRGAAAREQGSARRARTSWGGFEVRHQRRRRAAAAPPRLVRGGGTAGRGRAGGLSEMTTSVSDISERYQ